MPKTPSRFSSDPREAIEFGEVPAETMETLSGPRMSEAKVQELLGRANGDYRESWLSVGMALHHHYRGSSKGLDVWDKWASEFRSYEGYEDHAGQWATFRSVKNPVTLKSIQHAHPKEPEEFEEDEGEAISAETPREQASIYERFVKQHVLVESGSFVGLLSAEQSESVLKLQDVRNKYAHLSVMVETGKFDADEKPVMKAVSMTSHWLSDPDKKRVYDFIYTPGGGRMARSLNGGRRKYWNRYCPTQAQMVTEVDKLGAFTDHMKYLFPDEADKAWVLDWLAQMVQQPHVRPTTHILHLAPRHGTGRGWLVSLLGLLVGKENHKATNIGLLADDTGFSGFLDESVLVTIEETLEKGMGRFGVSSRMRDVLASKRQHVNRKYGMDGTIDVYSRFFMMSNHMDALVLDDNDRRIAVFASTARPKSEGYYDALYKKLEDSDFVSQVYSFLLNRVFNARVANHIIKNDARRNLILECRSDTGRAYLEFLAIVKDNWFSRDMFVTWAEARLEGLGVMLNHKELPHLYRDTIISRSGVAMCTEYRTPEEANTLDLDVAKQLLEQKL